MILAIVNQKGGVGKTTTTVNLAKAMADLGQKVLVVDMDPQGHAGTSLGVKLGNESLTVMDLLNPGYMGDASKVVRKRHGIDIWPSDMGLADLEPKYLSQPQGYYLLTESIERHAKEYDTILIDCPPHLGLGTLNALTAATHYLVPVAPGYLSLDGLQALEETVNQVRRYTNPQLQLLGVLLTRVDRRTAIPRETQSILEEAYGEKLLEVVVPETVSLTEAPAFGKPIQVYQRRSKGVEAYQALAREVIKRVA